MSFRAREFVKGQQSKPRVGRLPQEDHLAEGIGLVLAAESKRLRAKRPRQFRKVDRLLAGPRYTTHKILGEIDVGECVRCGEFYAKPYPNSRYCKDKCRDEHKAWLKARRRTEGVHHG